MKQVELADSIVETTIPLRQTERRSERQEQNTRLDYKILNSRGTTGMDKGGKRKRKMRGGGVCDNWAYEFAIDSVLVISGAAGMTAGMLAGWTALSVFMDAFGFTTTAIAAIEAVYDILRVISSHLLLKLPYAGFQTVSTTTKFLGHLTYDSIVEMLSNSDQLIDGALLRYILTENNAITDIGRVIETLKATYATLNDKVGVVTRSGQEKLAALQGQIDRLSSVVAAHAMTGLVAAQPANAFYKKIKEAICLAIDRGIEDVCLINVIIGLYGFRPIETNAGAGCTISGGRRRRKSKRSTRRGKRSTKRTKKNSRRSSRRK
jgi:hypothetical protein